MTPEAIKAALQAVVEEVKSVDVVIGHALEVFAEHIVALGSGTTAQTSTPASAQPTMPTPVAPVEAPATPATEDTKNGN